MSPAGTTNELQGRVSGRVGLDRAAELTHRGVGVDVACIVELAGAAEVCRAAAGDAGSFDITVDQESTRAATYCRKLLASELPSVIPDTAADERVATLPETQDARIGSFIGVPLHLSDGTLYGALCGLCHAPTPGLDARDVRFMSMLAELIVSDLDEQRRREQLRSDLLHLIETEDVHVAYQPIIDLHGQGCLGVEALARFPEPYTKPDRTLAAAEDLGLRLELERIVVSQAWRIIPLLAPAQFLALNLSPDALVSLARRARQRDDVCLSQVVVEVTEHAVVESYTALHRELVPLRERGLRIAVDDVGAGYASLRHVMELRPDFIKVDRSLIHGIAHDRARLVVVSALTSIATDLGATVIAEGVEQPADLSTIRELGLHAVQGYLLGRPTTSRQTLMRFLRPHVPRGDSAGSPRKRTRPGARRRAMKTGQGRAETQRADLARP